MTFLAVFIQQLTGFQLTEHHAGLLAVDEPVDCNFIMAVYFIMSFA